MLKKREAKEKYDREQIREGLVTKDDLKDILVPFKENLSLLVNDMTDVKVRNERSDKAMRQVMRQNLHQMFNECKKKGYTSDIDRSRFSDAYVSYRELGGNHEMEQIHELFFKLDSEEQYRNTKKAAHVKK